MAFVPCVSNVIRTGYDCASVCAFENARAIWRETRSVPRGAAVQVAVGGSGTKYIISSAMVASNLLLPV